MAYYGEEHVERLRLIRQLQERHLPLASIKRLLDRGVGADDVEVLLAARLAPELREGEEALAISDLREASLLDRAELEQLRELGLLGRPGAEGWSYAPDDLRLVRCLSEMRTLGLTPERGFDLELLGLYLGTLERLVRDEIGAVLERAGGDLGRAEIAQHAPQLVARVNELIALLHARVLQRAAQDLRSALQRSVRGARGLATSAARRSQGRRVRSSGREGARSRAPGRDHES